MKGKQGTKTKDIDGGFSAMEGQVIKQEKNNMEQMIQDKINQNNWDLQLKQGNMNHMNHGGVGHGLVNVNNPVNVAQYRPGFASMGQQNMEMTQEKMMAITGGRDQNQIDMLTMLSYYCGQYGHRSDGCKNAKMLILQHRF
jgi:hypothetical protein